MTTHPERRMDKNGVMVTRHVRDSAPKFGKRKPPAPVASTGEPVLCYNCKREFVRGSGHRCSAPQLMVLSSQTESALKSIRKAGGTPIIVGGSVRDSMIAKINGEEPKDFKDIDIEVYGIGDPELLKKSLRGVGRTNETGVSFGVLKVTIRDADGRPQEFDISLPRRDSKSGRGHRGFDVEFSADIDEVEAFGRRDFTINAMGYDPQTQELIDPYGGSQDLADGILRHTTSAFADDPLRVLRAVQFAGRFGFDIAPETAEESQRIKGSFEDVAVERVWGEFDKIFGRGTHISKAIKVLEETGWIEHFPELGRMKGVEQDPKWHPEGNVLTHLGLSGDKAAELADNYKLEEHDRKLVVFSAMVHDLGKFGEGTQFHYHDDGELDRITSIGHPELGEEPVRAFAERIGAPRSLVDPAIKLVRNHMKHIASSGKRPSTRAVRNLVRSLGDGKDGSNIRNWALLVQADQGGRGSASSLGNSWDWVEVANEIDSITPRKNLVNGEMLSAELGLKPGPIYRDIIAAATAAQDDEVFTDTEGALEWAREYIASNDIS